MRIGRAVGALVAALAMVGTGASVAQAQTAPATYYLSLGDSLSQGYQPTAPVVGSPGVNTTNGYADDLYQRLLPTEPGLVLEKYGCSGETTGSMLVVSPYCTGQTPVPAVYQGAPTSQVDAAVAFLKAHQGQVTHLTLDIGANDVQRCATSAGIDFGCVGQGLVGIAKNLPVILAKLRAASPLVHITGSTYYNPFLVYWLGSGSTDKFLALGSSALQVVLNQILTTSYSAFGAQTADVAGTFDSYAYVPFVASPYSPGAPVPLNVATLCTNTYMCLQQNIHATNSGYRLMADAFQRAGA